MRCGDTEDYQRNPHHTDNVDCLMDVISDTGTEDEYRELAVNRYHELVADNKAKRERAVREQAEEEGTFTRRIDIKGGQ